MSRQQRIALIAAAVVVAAVAFVVFRPSDDSSNNSASTQSSTTATGPASTAAAPNPSVQAIAVSGGKPDGGIKKIDVKKGDEVALKVTSSDTKDEVHLHGYDLHGELAPGKPVKISFTAKIEGVFEIELEGSKTQIAELKVEP